MDFQLKREKQDRRKKRIRAKISGTSQVPRLSVFRSHQHISAQLIDDSVEDSSKTLVFASSIELRMPDISPCVMAKEVGKLVAQKALPKKIKKVVFDRGGYKYHGRVKALAEGAREGGLQF